MMWNRRAGLLGIAGATAAAIAIGVATRWLPDRELTFSSRLSLIGCDAAKPEAGCHAWLAVTVGNTGNVAQETVRVRLPGAHATWRVDVRTSDIRASLSRRAEPVVQQLEEAGVTIYEIRPLPVNTLVELNGFCLGCAMEAVRGMGAAKAEVQGEGRMREGDPRTITLASGLLQFLAQLLP